MKKLSGRTLAEVIDEGTPSFSRNHLLRAFAEVCLAIEFAHSRGVIHRDIKPSNIVLGDFGEVYVIDWGIARVHGDQDAIRAVDAARAPDLTTRTGAGVGTKGYMAP